MNNELVETSVGGLQLYIKAFSLFLSEWHLEDLQTQRIPKSLTP